MEAFKIDSLLDSSSNYLSPHVHSIASLVYSECERLVAKYGEGVVDGIVPIMIRTLEQVDQLHESNELLQTTNFQNEEAIDSLTKRLDGEIKARRIAEEKIMALEDEIAEMHIQTHKKISDYTKLVRVLEAKCDSANEHVARQEAKEAELRRDLANAQNRCNELLCSHLSHIERTRKGVCSGTSEKPSSPGLNKYPSDEKLSPIEEMNQKKRDYYNGDTQGNSRILPVSGSIPPPANRTLEEDLFDVLSVTECCDDCMTEPTSTRLFSEEFDDPSKVLDDCEFMGSESLAAEVRKLVDENQDLTEMKNALNIVKDDLLSKIDDLTGNNIILKNDLTARNEELESAKLRERQLTQRIQELSSRLWVAEMRLENSRTGAIMKCASERQLHESPTTASGTLPRRRRTRSSSAAIRAVSSTSISNEPEKCKQPEQNSTPDRATGASNNNKSPTGGSGGNGSTLRLTKRQIARIIVERNYYKEHYFEVQDRLSALEMAVQYRTETSQPMRKRDMARALASGIFHSVRRFADNVAQDFGELLMPSVEPSSSLPPPPSQTSTALWNILGNFVGQAVTYTADAVIGTGNDLPLDVSRPMITDRVNSRLSTASETQENEEQPTSKTYPMYTDHSN
ncbi:hypothetical protein Aperf_G00000013210 [Anoplocephala perfoliata]